MVQCQCCLRKNSNFLSVHRGLELEPEPNKSKVESEPAWVPQHCFAFCFFPEGIKKEHLSKVALKRENFTVEKSRRRQKKMVEGRGGRAKIASSVLSRTPISDILGRIFAGGFLTVFIYFNIYLE